MGKMVRFHSFGGADVLKVEEVPTPAPGTGEVRIAVEAVGLNRADALWRENLYIEDATLPAGLGNEAAGVIEAVGSGVEGLKAGDKVAVLPGAGQGRYPTYGESILLPMAHVVRYPGNLSAAQAAGAYMAYLTGYFPMFEMAQLKRGQTLLVTGASSGTGIAALQMARAAGIVAIAVTRTAAKRDALREAGAAHVVVTDDEDVVERVLKLTEGRGVDLVYDGVGGAQVERLGDVVAHRGWYVLYGLSGGAEFRYPVIAQFSKSWRFHVYKVLEHTGAATMGLPRDEAALGRALAFIDAGLADGALQVRIDRTFALDDVVQAHQYLERAGHIGKVVLTV
ncbi:NADPH:quinone reductase-like Zn-dependent oxidoreductase [Variovorax boronicumulans]|uniref:zinc-dependent alcohol dehydrogenase family protein n=1 Tax=Variovorax boronicumulans TaxID=436515 RepID=UPI0024762A0A|nr:zinc-dependent alcohol dehydrogenase family protein [Variovorax boronicumulans]MDH6165982.1 NADPH:quinone reductase-like Zn-dependent oxidoreductase [Variovorax boronicumulans]